MNNRFESATSFGFPLAHENLSFWRLLRPYWPHLWWGGALLLLTNLVMVFLPALINGGVSIIEKDRPFSLNLAVVDINFVNIYWLVFAIVILALLGAVLRTLSRLVIFNIGRLIERDVRARLFFHISVLDDDFFSRYSVGDLMNHLTTDMTNIRLVTGFAVLNIVNIVFIYCFTLPLLLKIDVGIAVCALLPFPMVMIAIGQITKKMFQSTKNYQEQLSTLSGHIQENLLGAHVIRLFHQQESESVRFSKTNEATFLAGIKLARVRTLMLPVMRLMTGLAVGLVLWVGGQAIVSGRISLGDFVEVNARILQLAWPAMAVGFIMSIFSSGRASLGRVNALLAYPPQIKDGSRKMQAFSRLEVKNLELKAAAALTFSIKSGQMIGLVGPSGSYKSTLLKALYRRIPIPKARVFIDGHDVTDLTMESIYELMSVVSHDAFLFHKSIKENISFMRPSASDEEIDEVIKLVCLDRDLASFKDGLDTVIGERGITLSGGQRQRVALARALLAKRPILILDDALSSVDADTEHHIVAHLRHYVKDATLIMATHRLAALKSADQILVMDQGQIVETGSNDELIRHDGLYKKLLFQTDRS